MLNDQRIAILSAERMETGGRPRGFPYPGRLVRIDYTFHSDGWRAEAAWVGEWVCASPPRWYNGAPGKRL
jgi:hypothetical protein